MISLQSTRPIVGAEWYYKASSYHTVFAWSCTTTIVATCLTLSYDTVNLMDREAALALNGAISWTSMTLTSDINDAQVGF